MSTPTTYALRLPKSVKAEAEALSKADGTSLNQFVAIAVAEKIAMLKATAFFEERRQRATGTALDALLARTGGEAPRAGDELPEGYKSIGTTALPALPVKRVSKSSAAKSAVTSRRAALNKS
jgi:hypothetical protein